MTIIPNGDRYLVRPIEDSQTTAAGLTIPESLKAAKPMKGVVLARGPGAWLDGAFAPMCAAVGDTIYFDRTGPLPLEVDGEKLLFVMGRQVWCTIPAGSDE